MLLRVFLDELLAA